MLRVAACVAAVTPVCVMPVWNRPHYLTPVLESWRNVRGIEDARLFYTCEPGCPEMVDLICREAPRPQRAGWLEVITNKHQLGNDQNMKAAVQAGFATGAGFVIAAEDDVLVSADLLEYMAAMDAAYAGDKSVLAITAWQDQPPGPLDEVQRASWFWGGACWGMWRDRWEQVKDGWPPSGHGYDGYLWRLLGQTDRVTIQPLATRCKNIGEYGVNTQGGFEGVWEAQQFVADIPPQGYREAQ
jgi:hypothetical protein